MDVTGETFDEIAEQRSPVVKQTVDGREMADGEP